MPQSSITALVIGIALIALLIVRQLRIRRLWDNYRLMIISGVIGVIVFVYSLKDHTVSDSKIVAAVAGSLVLAGMFGVLWAPTVKIWRESGQLLIKGSWLSGILWAILPAPQIGYVYLVGGSAGKAGIALVVSAFFLYLAVAVTVQTFVLLRRVSRMDAAGRSAS